MKETIIKCLETASNILMEGYTEIDKDVQEKEPNDYVTKYDHLSEHAIVKIIQETYPEHSIVTEEKLSVDNQSEYRWIIDPLDGTLAFIQGKPTFMVTISLEHKGEIVMCGAMSPPNKLLFFAEKGKGTTLNGQQVYVSTREPTVLEYAGPPSSIEGMKNDKAYNTNSCVYGICSTACGRADAFWSKDAWIWDYSPYLLVTEAGGIVTNWEGETFNQKMKSLLCTNGVNHKKILQELHSKE